MKRRALLTLGGAGGAAFVLAGHRPAVMAADERKGRSAARRFGTGPYVVDLPALPPSDRRPAR